LVRQLVLRGNDSSRGVLRPSLIQDGIVAVTRELDDALRGRGAAGSVMHAEAAGLLSRTADTTAQAVARRALDLMLDDTAIAAGEDPPRLVRAALAWAATGETRYREAGRALVRELAAELPHLSALDANRTGAVFVDQEAYVIEQLLIAATTFGDSAAQHRAATELDALLQRTYARGWGVRHAITGAGPAGTTTPLGLLQDQVQVAAACLAAHQVTNGERYLDVAVDLAGVVERAFADPLGGYFDAADALPPQYAMPALADRTKNVFDDVLPGPNARAALLFAHLARVTGDPVYRRRAQATLEAFATAVNGVGLRASTYLAAAQEILGKP
jgi:hypothetical protein